MAYSLNFPPVDRGRFAKPGVGSFRSHPYRFCSSQLFAHAGGHRARRIAGKGREFGCVSSSRVFTSQFGHFRNRFGVYSGWPSPDKGPSLPSHWLAARSVSARVRVNYPVSVLVSVEIVIQGGLVPVAARQGRDETL